jgi:hypothetical protein
VTAEPAAQDSSAVLTRSGAHYVKFLTKRFVYVEECMFDTAIEDAAVWASLCDLTAAIEGEQYPSSRMELRYRRIEQFLLHLLALENENIALAPGLKHLTSLEAISAAVVEDAKDAIRRAKRYDEEARRI